MKKILVTGAGSYVGTSFINYMKRWSDEYVVVEIDMVDGSWRERDFSQYDAVFHVAGIAHQKETVENAPLYYKVNRDLAFETAEKAKKEGVKQFIFLSSMSVYGLTTGVVTKETVPRPNTNYGKSKLQAEEKIAPLADSRFGVVVLRPPMVYGPGCRGNFQTLLKLAKKTPVFPKIANRRSMIYIDNLSALIKICVDGELTGLYLPQNKEYANTTEIVEILAATLGRKIIVSATLGLGVALFRPCIGALQKAFGSLIYQNVEELEFEYCVCDNREAFMKSAADIK